jgi:ABC-type transport system involved in multi-copper enzyme maturation permease subunit
MTAARRLGWSPAARLRRPLEWAPATRPREDREERDGCAHTLRAEWTKFRTVRGWVVGAMLGAAVIVAFGLFPGQQGSCGKQGPGSECVLPVGPDGEQVTDVFTFVHRPLTGDGMLTVRVTSLTGRIPAAPTDTGASPGGHAPGGPAPTEDGSAGTRAGVVPWAKAGLLLTANTRPGSAYAAVMVTGGHGVRMQYDYTHDLAGPPDAVSAASPRWLQLSRTGETVTGSESADGAHWETVGHVRLAGVATTVQVGLFTTSPQYAAAVSGALAGAGAYGGPSRATATFDRVAVMGRWLADTWTGTDVGGGPESASPNSAIFEESGGVFTLTGSGDIAPAVPGAAGIGTTVTQTLAGTFIGLIAFLIVATMFITAEYRRGLVRTTLTACPRRGRTLLAKAIVVGAVSFASGLAGAAIVVAFGQRILHGHGVYVFPVTTFTEVRLVTGTGALLALAAVLALAVGTVVRRSTAAVTLTIVAIVLPYLLALSVLPIGAGQWLLRITPAAGFAIQQSVPRYGQVDNLYNPAAGYFPLTPWAGLMVLFAWVVLAFAAAAVCFRRRDV